ncbi:MAG: ATP-binding protein [Clostridiales bacterium]|jgi:anti-sigma regulatory factor (Ser/Thr protein kinase)|nr:ATP-binding protein [Clostridiales bacterium]
MADKEGSMDTIELSLPANAAYVTAARQTAQSIAGRAGFDADEVEEVKSAVSEACNYCIKKLAANGAGSFKIVFSPGKGRIEIKITCPTAGYGDDGEDDYSLTLIRGQMETFVITETDTGIEMVMSKRHMYGFLDSGLY